MLTKSARNEQLLVMPTESLTNREWLPGELLSVSECRRPGWFLDMKYQTCLAQEMGSCLAVDAKRYLLVLEYRYRWNVGGLSSITAEVRCLHFAWFSRSNCFPNTYTQHQIQQTWFWSFKWMEAGKKLYVTDNTTYKHWTCTIVAYIPIS